MLHSDALCTKEEFLKVLKLGSIDLVTVKLWLDKKVLAVKLSLLLLFLFYISFYKLLFSLRNLNRTS